MTSGAAPSPLSCGQICPASSRWRLNGQAHDCEGTQICRTTASSCPRVEPRSCLVLIKCLLCGCSQGMWLCSLARFLRLSPQCPYWGVGAHPTTRQRTHVLCREADQKTSASALPLLSSEIKGRLCHVFTSLKCCLLQVGLLDKFLIFIQFKI